jgi:hydroxypyruvate isomerase
LDIYHSQVEEGNITQMIRNYAKFIGYLHIADVPGRHEPSTGEIDYAHVVTALRQVGYSGPIAMEASPLES